MDEIDLFLNPTRVYSDDIHKKFVALNTLYPYYISFDIQTRCILIEYDWNSNINILECILNWINIFILCKKKVW